MKRFKTDQLIDDLKRDVQRLLECTDALRQEKDVWLQQPAPDKWSIAQILEHLNSYGRYYLPQIDKAITAHPQMQRSAWFNAGFIGDYFINTQKPKNVFEVKNKMKAMKGHIPDQSGLQPDAVLKEFVVQQQQLLQLLELSKMRDLNALRIPISISKWIKLKLGDTLRFLIAHEQRHFVQAYNTLRALGVSTSKFPVILPEAER